MKLSLKVSSIEEDKEKVYSSPISSPNTLYTMLKIVAASFPLFLGGGGGGGGSFFFGVIFLYLKRPNKMKPYPNHTLKRKEKQQQKPNQYFEKYS